MGQDKLDYSDRRVEQARWLIAIVALIVSGYYLYWRYTETFNMSALAFSWTLYGAELFGFLSTALFFFAAWKPKKRTAPPPLSGRSVDVFIPTKNESASVLRKTLLACNDLRYPHRTLVLDDGARPEVEALCKELNCVYLARKSSEHAKAGNLNYGLKHSQAEFIAIFDADHIPLPRFIDRLIGYFADEKVSFVQVPQEFYNIDSIQHRTDRKQRKIWGEQYLFFSVIQPGRDTWNAAYFVGSCAMIRRKSLDDIGGFATGSITEDMLTSIKLHAKGWSSVYHNENLAYGIAAETLKPFSIQRQRWGVGNWQVFMRANPLFIRGLTLSQRICYLSSMIYPLEGLQKIIFYATPPIALCSGVLPMRALDVSYLLHFIPYFLISTYAFNEMARGTGGQIILEQYSMAKFFTYLKTMVLPFIPKKSKVFKVTPKGEEKSGAALGLILPQYLVMLASFTAIIWALMELLFDRRSDRFIVAVNCFWALYNSGLALAIVHYDYKKLFQRRTEFRIPDTVVTSYHASGDRASDGSHAVASDITEDGMALLAFEQVPVGSEFDVALMLPQTSLQLRCKVVRERTVSIDRYQVSDVGMRFIDIPQRTKDILSRYLHYSAITKLMSNYVFGYETYLQRRFGARGRLHDRAARTLAYLPVRARCKDNDAVFAVIKDISETGLLLESPRAWSPGQKVTAEVILAGDTVSLTGDVVRNLTHANEDFPVYLLGVRLDGDQKEKVQNLLQIVHRLGDFIQ